jgi:iron complex transport system substrate-binding protein
VEKIIDANADAIFLSPFQNSGGYGPVVELGIPIVETADYMETSALGRAEWMKFYGMLFGVEEKADSIFREVESDYLSLKEQAATASRQKPRQSIVMDKQTGSVWYVPGGKSTIGKMITDAQADYAWSADDHSGSLALPFESVLEKAGNASFWFFRYNAPQPVTYASLLSEHHGYDHFDAFRNKKAYGCNTATSTFYEDTPFHPNLLLRDFVTVLYPELSLGEPRYFIHLQQ